MLLLLLLLLRLLLLLHGWDAVHPHNVCHLQLTNAQVLQGQVSGRSADCLVEGQVGGSACLLSCLLACLPPACFLACLPEVAW